MVCKRSLYCWKNGPCASDQTRKQIWEDNIRFRESLRSMNQSDHYWSFQISNGGGHNCRCVEEDFNRQRSALTKSYRTGSLQRLDRIDCSSITHPSDYSVQKINNNLEPRFRSSQVLCPLHLCPDGSTKNTSEADYENLYEKKSILKKEVPKIPLLPCNLNGSLNRAHKVKLTEDLPKYCPRYKNTLTATPLKSSYKIKFSSQPSLLSGKKTNLDVKKHFTSNEEVGGGQTEDKEGKENLPEKNNIELAKTQPRMNKNLSPISPEKKSKIYEGLKPPDTAGCDSGKVKKPKIFTRETYTPISRTTRRLLNEERKVPPFVTFGCNNDNKDVGSKRTHNVLASQHEVFPSALSAKTNRQNMIMKYLKTEKEFQKNLLPDDFRKKFVNHSSVWATEYDQKNKETNRDIASSKNYKKIPPLTDKRMKSQSLVNDSRKQLPLGKSLSRPSSQAYFY